jgi:hypothetical protein
MIEPTYLRYVYDKLNQKSLSSDNASNLPYGFIEIYEKSFQSNISIHNRHKIISKLTIWALLFEPMSVESVSKLYGCSVDEMKIIIEKFSTWFNVLENGYYEIYHQRLKLFILQKVSQNELIALLNKILICLHTNLNSEPKSQIVFYAYKYIHDYFKLCSTYTKKNHRVYKTISSRNFWDYQIKIIGDFQPTLSCLRFLVKDSIQKENIEKTITCLLNFSKYSYDSKNKENNISDSFINSDYTTILDEIKTFDNETKLKIYFLIIDHIVLKKEKEHFEFIIKITDEIINNPELIEINWLKFQSQKILYSHYKNLVEEGIDISILWKNCRLEIIEEFEIEFLEKLINHELNTYDHFRVKLRILELKFLKDDSFNLRDNIMFLLSNIETVESIKNNKHLFNEFELDLTSEKDRYNITICNRLNYLCEFLLKIKAYDFFEDIFIKSKKIIDLKYNNQNRQYRDHGLSQNKIYLDFLIQTSNPQFFIEKYNQDKFSLFKKNKRIIAPLEKYIKFYIDSNNEEYFEAAFSYYKTISKPLSDFSELIRLYVSIIEYYSIKKKLTSIEKYFIEFEKLIIEVDDDPNLTFYIPQLIKILYKLNFKDRIELLEKEYFKRIKIKSNPNYDHVSVLISNFELYKSYLNVGEIKKAEELLNNGFKSENYRFKGHLAKIENDYLNNRNIEDILNDILKLKNIFEERMFSSVEDYNLILNSIKENLLLKENLKDYLYLSSEKFKKAKQKPIRYRGVNLHPFFYSYVESVLNDLKKTDLNSIAHKKSLIKSKYLTLKIKIKEIEYLINNSIEFKEEVEYFYKSLEDLNYDFHKVDLKILLLEVFIDTNQNNLFIKHFNHFLIYIKSQEKNFELIYDIENQILSKLHYFVFKLLKNDFQNEKELFIKSFNSLKPDLIDYEVLDNLNKIEAVFNEIIETNEFKLIPHFYDLLFSPKSKFTSLFSVNNPYLFYYTRLFKTDNKDVIERLDCFDESAKKLFIQKLKNESDIKKTLKILYFISEKNLKFIIGEIDNGNNDYAKLKDYRSEIINTFLKKNYCYLESIGFDEKVFLQILKLNYLKVNSEFKVSSLETDLMAFFTALDPFQLTTGDQNIDFFKSIYNFKGMLK